MGTSPLSRIGNDVITLENDESTLDDLRPDQFEEVYEFVTMKDDKVCPICTPLNGILQKPTDTFFAKPPLHDKCRCILVLRGRRRC